MKNDVKLTKRAHDDRERAYDWYAANYSPEFALRWFVGITQAIESLSRNPERCPRAAENSKFPFELFEMLYGSKRNKHRVLYTIRDGNVLVLHIRHSAQRELRVDDLDE